MLPDEAERIALVKRKLQPQFSVGEHVVALAIEVHKRFVELPLPADEPRAQLVIASLLAQAITRLRAITSLCERAFPDEAEILVRSLFESRLTIRFILYPAIDGDWLLKMRGTFPPIPAGRSPMAFRDDLYMCAKPIKLNALSDKLVGDPLFDGPADAAAIQRTKAIMNDVESFIGPDWIKRLGHGHSYSGMSVKDLAEYCGHADYYKKLYGLQSGKVHGGDSLLYLAQGGVRSIESSMVLGATLLGECVEDFDKAFQLNQKKALKHVAERLARLVNPNHRKR